MIISVCNQFKQLHFLAWNFFSDSGNFMTAAFLFLGLCGSTYWLQYTNSFARYLSSCETTFFFLKLPCGFGHLYFLFCLL